MELDPDYPPTYLTPLEMGRVLSEDYIQAVLSLERATKLQRQDVNTHLILLATYGFLNQRDDATRVFDVLRELGSRSEPVTSAINLEGSPLGQSEG